MQRHKEQCVSKHVSSGTIAYGRTRRTMEFFTMCFFANTPRPREGEWRTSACCIAGVVGAVQSRRQPPCVVPPPLPASTMDSTAMADRHEVSGLLYGEISDAVALVGHSSLHRRRCEESCTARLRHVVRLAEGLLLAVGAEDPCNFRGGEGPGTCGKRVVRRECRERLPAKVTYGS